MTYYTVTGNPVNQSRGTSSLIRYEFSLIETGFAQVSSAIALLAPKASPTLTGVPLAPTATVGTNTDQIATTAFVTNQALTSTLPGQAGSSGKFLTTDGVTASWGAAEPVISSGTTAQYWRGDKTWQTLPTYGDAYTNTATSVDSELALFSGTGGKTFKRASASGIVKLAAGVIGTASAGTDFVAPSGALGTPSSGTLSGCTVDGTNGVGYINIPQITKVANGAPTTGADLTYEGKHIYHTSTAGTFTIPANSSIAYPIGTALTLINASGAGDLTIAITTDTMRLAGAGTTGSRTLSANGIATAVKVTSTEWIISGAGLT